MPGSLTDALTAMSQLVNWEQRPRHDMITATAPARDLANRLGLLQLGTRFVHVTGTKGKGSVCSLVEHALLSAGFVTGRYSSPHLQRINERVSVNGQSVSDAELAAALHLALGVHADATAAQTEGRDATWFDVLTVGALQAFASHGAQWVVVEVGLGGRLDSTNIIPAEIAVLTNVELEHVEILGSTRQAIATEKLGIIKRGAVLVTGISQYDELAPLITERTTAVEARSVHVEIEFEPSFEAKNIAIAQRILDEIGNRCTTGEPAHVTISGNLLTPDVVIGSRLPGRLERLSAKARSGAYVPVVMDVGHVAFSMELALTELADEKKGPCVALVALRPDKNVEEVADVLSRLCRHIFCTELPDQRGSISSSELTATLEQQGAHGHPVPNINTAWEAAVDLAAAEGGWVFVTGSFELVNRLYLRPSDPPITTAAGAGI